MKLNTTWDDRKYVWHYFTTFEEASEASQIGSLVVETTPHMIWRSRVGYSTAIFETLSNPLEGAVMVDTETLPDGSAPIRLSRSIRVF